MGIAFETFAGLSPFCVALGRTWICFLCLEGPGDHLEVILGSFWGSFLMFFGNVSGLFSGCPDLLGFCFWGAFSRDSLGFSRDSPGILDGSSRDSPGIL